VSAPQLLFYAFAFLAVFSAVAMVGFVRHVVAGVMSLVVTMISLAGIYVLLHAEFVAVVQIMVYAGAILVLFLFVVMLLDLREGGFARAARGHNLLKLSGAGGSLAIAVLLVATVPGVLATAPAPESVPEGFGTYRLLGLALYGKYVVAVELVGLLLLAAIVGAVVLAKRRLER
jgi:NADH-quinone oxidoreductase subunit J